MALTNRSKKVLADALRDMKGVNDELDAALEDIAAVKSSFDGTVNLEGGGTFTLTVEADVAGVAGDKQIVGDGVSDCDTLIGAGYTVSAGGASILKDLDVVEISGGVDAASSNGTLSDIAKFELRNGMCDDEAYEELVAAIENGSGSSALSSNTKKIMRWMFCDNRAYLDFLANM